LKKFLTKVGEKTIKEEGCLGGGTDRSLQGNATRLSRILEAKGKAVK